MDHQKLIARLELLEASASLIMQEAASIRKALQPVQTKKKEGLSDEQKAKLLAKRRANVARSMNR